MKTINKLVIFTLMIACLLLVGCSDKHEHKYTNGLCDCGKTSIHMHSFIDGVCECGKSSEGFNTKLDGFIIEGSTIKKFVGTNTDVVIPERYFCNNEYVSITTLDPFVFSNGVLEIDLEIPRTINNISPQALVGAGTLKSVYVNPHNKTFASVKGDLYSKDKTTLIRYTCDIVLEEYQVLDSVTNIGDFAFAYSMINKLIIGKNVTSIGKASFYGSVISNVEISEKNNYFISNENVIYSKDLSTLIYYLSGKTDEEFIIPGSVKCIKEAAFYNPFLLKNICIPNTVEVIEENAFVILSSININCAVSSKPSGWADNWTNNITNVHWDTNWGA